MHKLALSLAVTGALAAPAAAAADPVQIDLLGRTAPAGETGAEIAAYHPKTERAFVTNAAENALDIYSLRNPAAPSLVERVPLAPYGGGPNSVDVSERHGGVVAVAVEADDKTDNGSVELFDPYGNHIGDAPAGALPDMLTFTGDGKKLLVANEGEPNDDYTVDPEGSVTIVDLARGVRHARSKQVRFAGVPLAGPVRIFGPGASPSQDLEPEYIAAPEDKSGKAYVTLQENNAVGILDVDRARFRVVRSLGYKNHGLQRNAFDPSDRDGEEILPRPNVFGMYQPDAIAAYTEGRRTYLVTANEGDARDYDGFSEEQRAGSLPLDPAAFPAGAANSPAELARLNVTNTQGDTDGDGDYDRLYAFGGRSLSILDASADLVFDTGSEIERFTAAAPDGHYNKDHSPGSAEDDRSDNKGPEPEGVDTGRVGRHTYAFLGNERQTGVLAYKLSGPQARLAGYTNQRPADLGPEGVRFVDRKDSPTKDALLLVTHEVTGTLAVFAVR